jgi:hypothetical protein
MTNRHARAWELGAAVPPCKKSGLLLATLRREAAQERIVRAFRACLTDGIPGPTESELEAFARLAVEEMRLAQALVPLTARDLSIAGEPLSGHRDFAASLNRSTRSR